MLFKSYNLDPTMISTHNLKNSGIAGGLISLLGTLPFGVLNVLAFTIAAKESVGNALLFAFGVVLSEMIIVASCLRWVKLFRGKSKAFEILQYLMIVFIFFLAIQQLLQIGAMPGETKDLLSSNWPRFLLGLGLSAINPSQFPFWITWNEILGNKQLLETKKSRVSYLIGIGSGTFCGLLCFILVSQTVNTPSNLFHSTVYYLIMAGIFSFTGGLMLFKAIRNRSKMAY